MRLKLAVSIFLLPLCLSIPIPDAEAEARAQDPGMIMLNSMTLMPLLLAGAAFAKGYLFGNLKNLKSKSHYGGYGHRLGHPYDYAQYGYGRRISVEDPNVQGHYGSQYTPPGLYGGDYTTNHETTEYTPVDPYGAEYTNGQQSVEYSNDQVGTEYTSGSNYSPPHPDTQYSNNPHVIQYNPYHNYGY